MVNLFMSHLKIRNRYITELIEFKIIVAILWWGWGDIFSTFHPLSPQAQYCKHFATLVILMVNNQMNAIV